MLIYQVVEISNGTMIEEWQEYLGTDFSKAKEIKEQLLNQNEKHLTKREKAIYQIEGRIFEFPDNIDFNDEDALTDALCEYSDYDTF